MVFKFFTNTVNDSTNAQYQFEFGATTAHFAALNKSMRKGVIQVNIPGMQRSKVRQLNQSKEFNYSSTTTVYLNNFHG